MHTLKRKDVKTPALIDSGAQATFINVRLLYKLAQHPKRLEHPIKVFNVDDSPNSQGGITHYVDLCYKWAQKERQIRAFVTNIGRHDIILGWDWLKKVNPEINWRTGEIIEPLDVPRVVTSEPEPKKTRKPEKPWRDLTPRVRLVKTPKMAPTATVSLDEPLEPLPKFPPMIPNTPTTSSVQDDDSKWSLDLGYEEKETPGTEEDTLYEEYLQQMTTDPDSVGQLVSHISNGDGSFTAEQLELPSAMETLKDNTSTPTTYSIRRVTTATELAAAKAAGEKAKDMVPAYLHDLLPVFDKQTDSRLPAHTEYDHEINLKPGFTEMKTQVYPLNQAQHTELDKFIIENESKGYIRPSKSPVASPFFFVAKKDGTWRPCQDYRKLNENTVKDRYPLPLISDLLDKFKDAKIFTKMDLRAGYNNIRTLCAPPIK